MTLWLTRISTTINALNEWLGRMVAWLALGMVVVTFAVVVMRYGFDFGRIAIQETVTYFHAIAFMLAIAYTFKEDAHVRVDIFYGRMSQRGQAWVNLLGSILLLMPFCIYLLIASSGYALQSWQLLEGSAEAGGLPLVFILKTLIPAMAILLLLQAIATVCNSLVTLRGGS